MTMIAPQMIAAGTPLTQGVTLDPRREAAKQKALQAAQEYAASLQTNQPTNGGKVYPVIGQITTTKMVVLGGVAVIGIMMLRKKK